MGSLDKPRPFGYLKVEIGDDEYKKTAAQLIKLKSFTKGKYMVRAGNIFRYLTEAEYDYHKESGSMLMSELGITATEIKIITSR